MGNKCPHHIGNEKEKEFLTLERCPRIPSIPGQALNRLRSHRATTYLERADPLEHVEEDLGDEEDG